MEVYLCTSFDGEIIIIRHDIVEVFYIVEDTIFSFTSDLSFLLNKKLFFIDILKE